MLESVVVCSCLEDGTVINIKNIVIQWSAQWVIGRNVTAKCDIIHSKGNYLKLPNNIEVSQGNVDLHSYIPSRFFLNERFSLNACFQAKIYCASSTVSESENNLSWREVKKIIRKVHKHVCGHARSSAIQILLERNAMLNPEVQKYLRRFVESCIHCAKAYDKAFHNEIFLKYLDTYGIEARTISARRHNKNVLESNHKIIRDIFLRLKSEYGNISETLAVQQSSRISNNLYGDELCAFCELA